MQRATLFNLDALVELILGLVLLFNPLLGPVLPAPGWVIAIAAVSLLVGACVLGRAGMGKGSLVAKIAALGAINLASAALGVGWALWRCHGNGRIFVLVVSAIVALLGLAQLRPRSNSRPTTNARRATVEELQQALNANAD